MRRATASITPESSEMANAASAVAIYVRAKSSTTSGANGPYLASFCVLPASLAFFFAYGRFVEFLPPRSVFYASVVPLV